MGVGEGTIAQFPFPCWWVSEEGRGATAASVFAAIAQLQIPCRVLEYASLWAHITGGEEGRKPQRQGATVPS